MNTTENPLQLHAQLNAVLLPLDHLFPSPTNPRKRKGFDEKSLNELAASMRPPLGILEPILVRVALQDDGFGAVENKGNFEIIAGERRWRAARIAGLTQAPCILKTFDDEQVLQAQLIENKRREDLDALEEAEGYEKLLQQKNSAGEPYTVQMIADAMGVSKGTIYARMKLLALCDDARKAFYEGKLDASTALLIARIPVEKLQLQALKKLTEEAGWGNQFTATGDKMSFRRARQLVQDEFMLDLDRAIFNPADATLREAGLEVTLKSSTPSLPQENAKAREKAERELAIENTWRGRLFDTLHAKIETDMHDPASSTFPVLYRKLAEQIMHDHDYYDAEDMVALLRKFTTLPEAKEGEDIDWESHIEEFRSNMDKLTPAQHLMLIIELPLICQEITAGIHHGEPENMMELASELGIDAAGMRKEVTKHHDAEVSRAKAADKKKAAAKPVEKSPEPVKVRPMATWPFPTPL